MARIAIEIADGTNRLMLQLMLRNAGHEIVGEAAEVFIIDEPLRLPELPAAAQVLILTTLTGISGAVDAMKAGAFGYILLPFQPGETEIMVERALHGSSTLSGEQNGEKENTLKPLLEVEQEYIRRVLRQCRNNQLQAARILGIGRNTLWRKLKQMDSGTGGKIVE